MHRLGLCSDTQIHDAKGEWTGKDGNSHFDHSLCGPCGKRCARTILSPLQRRESRELLSCWVAPGHRGAGIQTRVSLAPQPTAFLPLRPATLGAPFSLRRAGSSLHALSPFTFSQRGTFFTEVKMRATWLTKYANELIK